MYTLGINAAFHDSAAVLLQDGRLIAAAEDERFTHIKHGKRPLPFSAYELPFHAIDYCLQEAGIGLAAIDQVAYSFDPSLVASPDPGMPSDHPLPYAQVQLNGHSFYGKWDGLFLSYIRQAPFLLEQAIPHHLGQRLSHSGRLKARWHFVGHHLAHAASAFFPSPFSEAAVLTLDGRGEAISTAYYMGRGSELDKLGEVEIPHSLGLLYEKITSHLGFLHSSDEYKVMALASYGKPVLTDAFRSLIHWEGEGIYRIDDFDPVALLGPARGKGDPFTDHHFNIAHSLQKVLEETVLKIVVWLHARTGAAYLCMAGGVALNCVLNAVVRDQGPFKRVWVQPAAGDAGTALGAAMWIDRERYIHGGDKQLEHAYWGPAYGDDEVEQLLQWMKVPYRRMEQVAAETAALLAQDRIVGWFQGRMEFGPRALGSRSILASPRKAAMQQQLNDIKDREDFRPVAPVVPEELAADWFEGAGVSPYMLFVYPVKEDKAALIPAVRHVDNTARIQTVNRRQHALYYDLLMEFYKLTGVPVLINTSFNTRGEPIVCSPKDAIACFWTSPFDALVINSFLVEKEKPL